MQNILSWFRLDKYFPEESNKLCHLGIIVMFLLAVWTLILMAPIHCR